MKNLIENIDCDKKETYEREKEYLLYLIRQKEEAAKIPSTRLKTI